MPPRGCIVACRSIRNCTCCAAFLPGERTEEQRVAYERFYREVADNQLVGEFQVRYLRTEGVAERLYQHNPEMKLLVVLRNPIERAYSAYVHHYTLSKAEAGWIPFRQAIDQLPDLLVEPGFYAKRLSPFLERFPRDQLLVLLQDDIKSDPVAVAQRAYRFLGVNGTFMPDNASRRVAAGAFKQTRLGRFLHRRITPLLKKSGLGWKLNESRAIGHLFYRFADWYGKRGEQAPPLDRESCQYLRDLYTEDIEQLEQILNRDLSQWRDCSAQ